MNDCFCKFIPPRSDFLPTMSAEERDLMRRHGDDMNDLLAQGVIVAHGPVMDPAGGYGVSLYQIADDQEISDLTSADPIVQSGVGHHEHFPMLSLRARGEGPLVR